MTQRVNTYDLVSLLERVLHDSSPRLRERGADHVARVTAARWLVQAHLIGLHDFGIGLLARDLDAFGTPSTGRRACTEQTINAGGMPGVLALAHATESALESARTQGIAMVGVRDVGGLGVLGFAARKIAEQGLIGIIMANSPAFVAPWQGHQAVVGTNPLAFAAPRSGSTPLVVDFATAAVTVATLRAHRETGSPLPAGVALTVSGDPTIDPAAASTLTAANLTASLVALMIEIIAGAATGSRDINAQNGQGAESRRGAVVIAVDPRALGSTNFESAVTHIGELWQTAGGHLPARFDALGGSDDPLPECIDMPARAVKMLHTLRTRWGAEE